MIPKILAVLVVVVAIGVSGTYIVSETACPTTDPVGEVGYFSPNESTCSTACTVSCCDMEPANAELDGKATAAAAMLGGCAVGAKTCTAVGARTNPVGSLRVE
jgi:hypothetical protein